MGFPYVIPASQATDAELAAAFTDPTITGTATITGRIIGGFGSKDATLTDWNSAANIRSGFSQSLMQGTQSNGPGTGQFFHLMNCEYITKDGSGDISQLAIPYTLGNVGPYFRARFNGTWSTWARIISENSSGYVGIGMQTAAAARLHVTSTSGDILRLAYSATQYASFQVTVAGKLCILPTGTSPEVQIAGASDKLSFYGGTGVVKRTGAAQAAVVTTSPALSSYGFTQAQATSIITLVNELRAAMVALNLIAGA